MTENRVLGTRNLPRSVVHIVLMAPNRKICLEHNERLNALNFLGGKVEVGESEMDALIREVQEETGGIVSLKLEDTVLVDTNTKYFPQVPLHEGSQEGTWFRGELYVGKISDKIVHILETTQNTISVGTIASYRLDNESTFCSDKNQILREIELCQKAYNTHFSYQ